MSSPERWCEASAALGSRRSCRRRSADVSPSDTWKPQALRRNRITWGARRCGAALASRFGSERVGGRGNFRYQSPRQSIEHGLGFGVVVRCPAFEEYGASVAQPIVVTSVSPTVIPRDANGLVFGGIRLATVEVPTATNDGVNGSTGFCNLYGSHTPFPDSMIQQLYPSHQRYVDAVSAVTQKNLRDRFILSEDAAEIIDTAEESTIGTNVPRPVP